MAKIELNIPSKFSHSRFLGTNGEKINVTKKDMDYFYTLIYLYRLELLELSPNCLSTEIVEDDEKKGGKQKKKTVIEENVKFDETLSFEFYQIENTVQHYKQHNSKYEALRNFINTFKDVYVETNLFDKDKIEASKIMKVFDKLDLGDDDVSMNVKFSREYISPYIVTEKYFKKVRLDILYRFSSSYAKKMYLFLKDYSNCEKKTTRKKLSIFLGENFNENKIKKYISSINKTDIKVELGVPKNRKKSEIKFIVEKQNYFTEEGEQYSYNLEQFIMDDCKKITQARIDNGGSVEDFDLYAKSILNKKLNSECELSKYASMYEINLYIKQAKEASRSKLDPNKEYPIFYIIDDNKIIDSDLGFLIKDNYQLVGFPSFQIIESDPVKTWERIQDLTDFRIHYCTQQVKDQLLITFSSSER